MPLWNGQFLCTYLHTVDVHVFLRLSKKKKKLYNNNYTKTNNKVFNLEKRIIAYFQNIHTCIYMLCCHSIYSNCLVHGTHCITHVPV